MRRALENCCRKCGWDKVTLLCKVPLEPYRSRLRVILEEVTRALARCDLELTGKQKRFLRGLGSTMEPVLQVGKEGVTEGVIEQAEDALEARELIKVKLLRYCPEEPKTVAAELVHATRAEIAQIIGHTILLYRPSRNKPSQIELP